MINKIYDSYITEWIDNNREDIIEKWMELIKVPSIKSDKEPCAPFGKNCALALEKASDYFSSYGINSKVYTDDGYAIASLNNNEKTIGLFSHSDVVPVGDDWQFTKPFEPIIKDGSLIGRGAEDNKSGIIASLALMKFIKDYNIPIKSNVIAFIGSDEECGMEDLKAYIKSHEIPDMSIVPDAEFPCSVGEKGIYHMWLKAVNEFTDIISFTGGEAFNIVLDKAKVVIKYTEALYNELASKVTQESSVTLEKNEDTITICAKGIAKHASIPEGSLNAAVVLCKILCACDNLCKNDKIILSNALTTLDDYYGSGLNCAHEDENFGKLTCVNGMVKIEENRLMLSFDIRYGSTLCSEILINNTTSSAQSLGFTIESPSNSEGFFIDKNSEIPGVLESVFEEVTGDKINRVLMSGGTYARKLKNAFSVGTFYITNDRKNSVLEMPDGHGGPHQCDECIDIEGFFTALRILIHYVISCDNLLNS